MSLQIKLLSSSIGMVATLTFPLSGWAGNSFDQQFVYLDELYTVQQGSYHNIVLEKKNQGHGTEYEVREVVPFESTPSTSSRSLSGFSAANQTLYVDDLESRIEGTSGLYEVMLERVADTNPMRFRLRSARKKDTAMSELKEQLTSAEIENFIEEIRRDNNVVGLAVAVTHGQEIIWSQGFGYADQDEQITATANTPFRLGSVSKTFLGVAMMQSVENKLITLEQPINQVSSYPITQLKHPEHPITFRHLANHSSGIQDNWVYECSYYFTASPEKNLYQQLGLGEGYHCPQGFSRDTDTFIQQYVSAGVSGYSPSNSFNSFRPGEHYDYSNVAAGLAAQLIGKVNDQSINQLLRKQVFEPLMMVNTGYFAEDFSAYQYRSQSYLLENDSPVALAEYTFPTYTDGGLYSSANDLGRYLIALGNEGNFLGTQILTPDSIEQLFAAQIEDSDGQQHGLFWSLEGSLAFHTGGDPGVATIVILDRKTKLGVIVLANSSSLEEEESSLELISGVLMSVAQESLAQED